MTELIKETTMQITTLEQDKKYEIKVVAVNEGKLESDSTVSEAFVTKEPFGKCIQIGFASKYSTHKAC